MAGKPKKIGDTRVCKSCKVEKVIVAFYRYNRTHENGKVYDTVETTCMECKRIKRDSKPRKKAISASKPGSKVCMSCSVEKGVHEFGVHKQNKDGLRTDCKACLSKYHDKRKVRDKDKLKAMYLRMRVAKYGLTVEQYEEMVHKCHGKCEICGDKTENNVIDHCHTTGKVRGILCRNCNLTIGMAKDNITLLKSMIKYLEVHK